MGSRIRTLFQPSICTFFVWKPADDFHHLKPTCAWKLHESVTSVTMIQRVILAGSPTLLLEWSILQFTEWWYFTPTRFACIVLHCHIEDPCLNPGFVDMMRSKSHYRFEDVVLIDFSSIHPSLPYKDIPSHLFSFGQTWISLHFSTWDWCYFACEPFHLLYFSDGVETWNQPPLSSENGKMACVMFCENMDPQLLAMAPSFTLVPSRAASKCWS